MLSGTAPLAILALGLPAFADVRIVGTSGPGQFATIQAALDASADGDVILVEPGSYPGFANFGKSVHILRRTGTGAVNVGRSKVSGVPSGGATSISHVRFESQDAAAAMVISSCAGAVRLQHCQFENAATEGANGVSTDASSNIAMSHCTSVGGNGRGGATQWTGGFTGISTPGGEALQFHSSAVALYQTVATGGNAGTATYWVSTLTTGRGGAGCWLRGSFALAVGSTIKGGNGGRLQLSSNVCSMSSNISELGRGGHGVTCNWSTPSQTWFFATTPAPGAGGTSNCSFTYPEWPPARRFENGPAGSTVARVGGAIDRRMSLQPLLVGSSTLDATFAGAPGELVQVLVSPTAAFVWTQGMAGVLTLSLANSLPSQTVGLLDAAGALTAPIALPQLSATAPNESWHLQPVFVSAAGATRLGTPYCVTLVP